MSSRKGTQVFCDNTHCVHNEPEYHNENVCNAKFIALNGQGKCQTRQLPPPRPIPGQTTIDVKE